jgi:drug/metabolite transporter (DMT)-like permease
MIKQIKADLSILSITLIWGSSFIIMKNISEDIPAYAFLALRFSVAGILMLLLFHKKLKNINFKALWSGSVVGFFIYAGMMLQVLGLKTTSASNSAFITGLNVVMVPAFSAAILKKRPPINAVIGVIMAALGLFAIKGFTGKWVIGDTLTLLCAVCFALQIIFIDKFALDVDEYQLAVVQIVFAALLYAATWAAFGITVHSEPIAFDSKLITTVLYTGALGTAFAFGVQTIAQKHTTPTRTALIITFEPVFAAIFALIVPDNYGARETLKLETIIGCLLILFGMIITELKFGESREDSLQQ